MGVNSLSKTVTRRQRRDCDLHPGVSYRGFYGFGKLRRCPLVGRRNRGCSIARQRWTLLVGQVVSIS